MGKEEIAPNEQFLLFPQCILTFQRYLKLSSANAFSLEEFEICPLGKSKAVTTQS